MALIVQSTDITLNDATTLLNIAANDDLLLTETADLIQQGAGVGIFAGSGGNNLDLRGTVTTAQFSAVSVGGAAGTNDFGDNRVIIDEAAEIAAFGSGTTLIVGGGNNEVINSGSVTSFESTAISLLGDDNYFVNHGMIAGNGHGLFVNQTTTGGAELINYGSISSENIAVEILDLASTFTNHGVVTGGTLSFFGAFEDDTVINRGIMNGAVSLTQGNDTFDNLGGTLNGSVLGGLGNDTYIVDDTDINIVELSGEGVDTVQSTVSFRLGANVESLFLLGGADINGFGNTQSNGLVGNIGDNLLQGGNGADILNGMEGDDILRGNRGGDQFQFSEGNDTFNGGLGIDVVDYSSAGEAVFVDLAAKTASFSDKTDSLQGIEEVVGTSDDDVLNGNGQANSLTGSAGEDTINGRNGNDMLLGGGSSDTINGGNGADFIEGAGGADILTGGGGSDVFNFKSFAHSGAGGGLRDQITDFQRGADLIDLATIDADITTVGNQVFAFIGSSAFSGAAGELRFVNQGSQTRILGDVDGDSNADLEVLLTSGTNLNAGDFIL